jgi:hypothetical protein
LPQSQCASLDFEPIGLTAPIIERAAGADKLCDELPHLRHRLVPGSPLRHAFQREQRDRVRREALGARLLEDRHDRLSHLRRRHLAQHRNRVALPEQHADGNEG